jgi:hypothetical protein
MGGRGAGGTLIFSFSDFFLIDHFGLIFLSPKTSFFSLKNLFCSNQIKNLYLILNDYRLGKKSKVVKVLKSINYRG